MTRSEGAQDRRGAGCHTRLLSDTVHPFAYQMLIARPALLRARVAPRGVKRAGLVVRAAAAENVGPSIAVAVALPVTALAVASAVNSAIDPEAVKSYFDLTAGAFL